MALPKVWSPAAAAQEVEVDTFIRLQDMIDVKLIPAPVHGGLWRFPVLFSAAEFFVGHVQVEGPSLDVQFNLIAVLNQGQGASHRRFGSYVQHNGSVGGSGHPGIAFGTGCGLGER